MASAALPAYAPFDTDAELSSLPQKWDEWIQGLEILLIAVDITDHDRKWATLQFYGGEKILKVVQPLNYDKEAVYDANPNGNPPVAGTPNHYRRLKEALTAHFAPCINETYATASPQLMTPALTTHTSIIYSHSTLARRSR